MSCYKCIHRYSDECNPDSSGYTTRDEYGECPADDPVSTISTFGEGAELHTFEEGDPIDDKPSWAD